MALKRVFAGFYTRYDGKPIFVVRVLKDIDLSLIHIEMCIRDRYSSVHVRIVRGKKNTLELLFCQNHVHLEAQ